MRLEELPDDQLVSCWRGRLRDANEAEGEAYRLRDEAEEIAGMLASRGFRQQGDEWLLARPRAGRNAT